MSSVVSIIVPIYNAENTLHRCVDSLVNQSYQNLEILLVNDGSTDGTAKICNEYAMKDNRIKVLQQTNLGVSAARNKGLENVTGEYIAFVDADDELSPNAIQAMLTRSIQLSAEIAAQNKNCSLYILLPHNN